MDTPKTKQQEPVRQYVVRVASKEDDELLVEINGEIHTAEQFEFVAPFGAGFKVARITRILLG